MKRSPLRRNSPLKRRQTLHSKSKAALKKTQLKQVSKKTREWLVKYRTAKSLCPPFLRPADHPNTIVHRDTCDPHHPFGRSGNKVLAFVWVQKAMHNLIHDNGQWARRVGWLHPPFWGMPLNDGWPRPWPEECEKGWPEQYRRK